jgi:hypothetical protein
VLGILVDKLTVNSTARRLDVLYADGSHDTFRYERPSPESIVENCLAGIEGPWDPRDLALAIVAGLADEDFIR